MAYPEEFKKWKMIEAAALGIGPVTTEKILMGKSERLTEVLVPDQGKKIFLVTFYFHFQIFFFFFSLLFFFYLIFKIFIYKIQLLLLLLLLLFFLKIIYLFFLICYKIPFYY